MAFLDLPGLTRFTSKMKTWVTNQISNIHPIKSINGTVTPNSNGNADISSIAVMLASQSLSNAQKSQVRTNIGAADSSLASTSTATLSPATSKITDQGSQCIKIGKLVVVGISFEVNSNQTVTNSGALYTIPSAYRPSQTVYAMTMTGINNSGVLRTRPNLIKIASNGSVTQTWSDSYSGWITALFVYNV